MDVKKHHQKSNFFVKWFLNNRFSIALLNILLFFLIILVFNQISFVLNPFWTFFNAIFPPILVASIQYYLMDPVVDWMEKKIKSSPNNYDYSTVCYRCRRIDLDH